MLLLLGQDGGRKKGEHTCYATLQTIGIDLLPLREKIHNFHKNAWIFKNSVSFFFWDICPHDKTKLKIIQN